MARPSFILFSGELYASEVSVVEQHLETVFADERIYCTCGHIRGVISAEGQPGRMVLMFKFRCSCGTLVYDRRISVVRNHALMLHPVPAIM